MTEMQKQQLEYLDKRVSELEYRNQSLANPKELEELIKVLKSQGVHRFNMGSIHIEMPYNPQPQPSMGQPKAGNSF